ncbi:MAG: RluA family pseudouridine synthase [Candidatus Pacebacteria bacterium]|nr:RluA family pseudouridine synthase [Candidatus Paceibacterota bacterium]
MNDTSIKITAAQSNQRLDKFLADFDGAKSRSAWQKLIKSGHITINGEQKEANYILKENDEVAILPEEKENNRKEIKIPNIEILYEDETVIVIDKPIGVVAQKAETSDAPAVTDFLESHFPSIKKIGESEQKSGIVHRLDKDTSGIMIAAKTQEAFEFLKNKFKKREVRKIYTTLVYGKVEPEEGEIDFAIGRNPKMPCKQTIVKNPEKSDIKSREARTLYKTLKGYKNYSLLSVELKTGRMHQIRVHMKAIGHPVVGDQKYADSRLLKTAPELQRQFLHATELKITLPDGKERTFKSDLPSDLKDFIKKLYSLD